MVKIGVCMTKSKLAPAFQGAFVIAVIFGFIVSVTWGTFATLRMAGIGEGTIIDSAFDLHLLIPISLAIAVFVLIIGGRKLRR